VTIGGVAASVTNWSDTQITVTVPSVGGASGIPLCAIQQEQQYSNLAGPAGRTYCGELLITAGNGKQSVDAVTVTVGGSAPKYVAGTTPMSPTGVGSIQQAIDAANPGDLIIVPPGTYNEMLLMWKPVRLQGVGAATSIINANTHPAGKLNDWRARIDCLMGLGPDATLGDVKVKYKALVKQHHPDANGGDRSTEDRLIEIIKAYNYLKTIVRES